MGRDQRAPRIEGEPVMPKEVSLEAKVFDRYVGRYQLTPAIILTLSRNDTHLFVQLTGQPPIEIFASSDREFFLKAVNAQISVEVDGQGRAVGAVLHQNGRDQRAARIE
jgi:serine-type D-Ala-D-Ala carboxypeptidase/endopeptidase